MKRVASPATVGRQLQSSRHTSRARTPRIGLLTGYEAQLLHYGLPPSKVKGTAHKRRKFLASRHGQQTCPMISDTRVPR